MEIELIVVGNEILLGETIDTNSAHVGERLREIGARVSRITTVGDERGAIADAVRGARSRARWALTMGGLGPTRDDLTRDVVAEVFDRELRVDDEQLELVREKFRRFGYDEMPASNRCQAEIPEGARVIPNPHGTAPGLVLEDDGFTLFVLPGVPGEMKAMLEDAVLPSLLEAVEEGAPVVASRVVHTVGIGESALAERLDDLVDDAGSVEVAFLPHLGQVDVRLTITGVPSGEANERLDGLARRVADRAGRWFYGFDDDTLAGAVGKALLDRGWTVGVAESCTAGGLGARITEEPGSSAWFVGGVLAYADEVKRDLLGVPAETLAEHGAVSEATCRAMAAGIRARLDVDVGVSITGIAGPGGATGEKPVGRVHCGVETPFEAKIRTLTYPGSRASVRDRSVLAAMALLLQSASGAS